MTVDDLPVHSDLPRGVSRVDIVRKMLKSLRSNSIPEVYGFINAYWLEKEPALAEIFQLWTEAGFPLGNHTYSHKNLNDVSVAEFQNEIIKNENALQAYSGQMPWKYFRFPFLGEGGSRRKHSEIRSFLQQRGYTIAEVSLDFQDWAWNDAYARCVNKNLSVRVQDLKNIYLKHAVEQLKKSETLSQKLFKRSMDQILLLHGGAFTAVMMDDLIATFKQEGVQFIPLSEATRDPAYSIDHGRGMDAGKDFLQQAMLSRGLVYPEQHPDIEDVLDTYCN